MSTRSSNPTTTSTATIASTQAHAEKDKRIYYAEDKIAHNHKIINNVRTFASIAAGCVSGVFGLTSLNGFLFYIVVSVLLSVLLMFKSKFNTRDYFKSQSSIWLEGLFGGLMSYILFWTLVYDVVYIFF